MSIRFPGSPIARNGGPALLLLCGLVLAPGAQAAPERWVVATDLWGNAEYRTLVIDDRDGNFEGTLGGEPVTARRTGRRLTVTTPDGRYDGTIRGDRITGTADLPDINLASVRARHGFTARRIPPRPAGGARVVDFTPTSWSNAFDPHRAPVLTLWPGDTLRTETLDSGGMDSHGQTRALFGNPQIGPFFIAGAEPGDTLVIRIGRLRLNRDFADSRDEIVGRAMTPGLAVRAAGTGTRVRWRLDRDTGLASPEGGTGALADYAIPVRPMLGGLAVAPGGATPVSTGDSGRFGGNMDFNEVIAGNTVLLPVQQPGALLYLGDGHARQGDGETSQWGLETSLDVELTVDLVKADPGGGGAIQMPLVESPGEIMALGQAGSLDEAVRLATDGLVRWMGRDYGLTLAQSAQLLGVAARYSIVTLAGRNAGIAARIDKSALPRKPGDPAPGPARR